MRLKLVGKEQYEVHYNDKVIGRFDKYDLDRLNNSQIGTSIVW